jgi:hypothetical protein
MYGKSNYGSKSGVISLEGFNVMGVLNKVRLPPATILTCFTYYMGAGLQLFQTKLKNIFTGI